MNQPAISFDVETTATQNLKAVGAKAYLRHPETDVILFAWHAVGASEQPEVWFSGQPCPPRLREHVENGGVLTGWNTLSFDAIAWDVILVERYGFPRIQRSQWQDSMQLAAAANLPRSLDGCAKAVGAPYQADLKDNNILRRITNKIKTPVVQGADLEWLTNRCIQDVSMEEETLKRLPPWFSMPPWDRMREIDREINDRGILMDVELVKGLRKIAEEETRRLDKQMYDLTGGVVRSTSVIESLKTWLISRGVELPLKGSSPSDEDEGDEDDEREPEKAVYRLRKSDIADILARPDVPEDCRQALEWRQEAAKASVKKLKKMLESMDPDGRLRGALILGGAQQTLRWCLAEGSLVLVKTPDGTVMEKPIETVSQSDMVWDGCEWVNHDGVVFSGYKKVIWHDNVLATKTHRVFWDRFTKVPLGWMKKHGVSIFQGDVAAPVPSERGDISHFFRWDDTYQPTYDILNAGPRNRFMANGRIVSNSGAAWQPHNFVRDSVGNADDIEITHGIKKSQNPKEFERITNLTIHNAVNIGRLGDRDLAEMLCTATRKDAQGRVRVEGVLPWVGRMLRRTLAAKDDHVFLEADYAQIEPRTSLWLANQKDKVEAFRDGVDVYRLQAAPVFHKSMDAVTYFERQVGKCQVIFLGYAGGVNAFIPAASNYGLRFSREEAEPLVKAYRQDNADMVRYWDANLAAAVEAVMYPGKTVRVPPLETLYWIVEGNCLMCVLPSGRPVRYWGPRLEQGYWPDGRPKNDLDLTILAIKGRAIFRRTLWRGLAVEGQSQAIGADLLAQALVNMKDAGLPVVLHVHDAVIAEVHKSVAEKRLPEFEACMLSQPSWTKGLPIAVSSEITPRFG